MGSSSRTYTDLQVVPVMDEYRDLDKVLLLYDAQNISNGMSAVFESRKRTMLKMRSTLNKGVMTNLGFEAATTATVQKVDKDLVLNYLQTTIGETVTEVVFADVGLATTTELGHFALQDIYLDYDMGSREFTHTAGYTYVYYYTVDSGGGFLDVVSYKKPTEVYLLGLLASTYDTVVINTFSPAPVESFPDVFKIVVDTTYSSYYVTVSVDDGSTVEETSYTTTLIGSVVEGVVVEGGTTTTTTIVVTAGIDTTVLFDVEFLYLQVPNRYYTFMQDIVATFSGTFVDNHIPGWQKTVSTDEGFVVTYGLGGYPYSVTENYTVLDVYYDYTATVVGTTSTSITTDVVATSTSYGDGWLSHPAYPSLNGALSVYEKARIDSAISTIFQAEYQAIVTKYVNNGKPYLYYIEPEFTAAFIVSEAVSVLPIIALKTGGVLSNNPKTKVALREMGMMGTEFDDSLANNDIKYASLGFMFDPNVDNPVTSRLMFETFYYMTSAISLGSKEPTTVTGFTMTFESLSIEVQSSQSITVVSGSVGIVGTYTSEISTYVIDEAVEDIEGGSSIRPVTKVRRIYRKQVDDSIYLELNIASLTVVHTYAGTSSVTFRSAGGDYLAVGRIPLIREVIRTLPFNKYLETLQMGMALFVYSSVTVTSQWYQSGLFKFFIMAVAVVAAVYTSGESIVVYNAIMAGAAVTWTAALTIVAGIGAIAGAILAVAAYIGVDLGVAGDVLQVVAIIGGLAAIANITIVAMQTPAVAAGSASPIAQVTATKAAEGASIASASGDTFLAAKFSTLANEWVELTSQFDIVSMGNVAGAGEALSPAMNAVNTATSNLSFSLTSSTLPRIAIPQATGTIDVMMSTFESSGVKTTLKVVSGIGDAVSQIKGMMDQHVLEELAKDLKKMEEMRDLAQAELAALQESQGQALMLAPHQIDSMYDSMFNLPDPMIGFTDMHASLCATTSSSMESLIWA